MTLLKTASLLLTLVLPLLPFSAYAGDGEFNGDFYSRLSGDLSLDNEDEDYLESHSLLLLRGKYFLDSEDVDTTFYSSAIFQYNILQGPDTRYRWNADIWEAYAEMTFDNFDVKVGKLVKKWGKADGINPTDAPNPGNMEEMLLTEADIQKVPIPMAVVEYYFSDYRLEFILTPFYYPMNFNLYGDDWSMLKRSVLRDVELLGIDLEQVVDYAGALGKVDFPAKHPGNMEYGLSFGTAGAEIDWRIYYYYGWQDQPVIYLDEAFIDYLAQSPGDNALKKMETLQPQEIAAFLPLFTLRTHRTNMLGLDFSAFAGDAILRGEGAYYNNSKMYTKDLEIYDTQAAMWIFGGDYTLPLPVDIFINLQFIQFIIIDYQENTMLFDQFNQFLSLALRRSFLHEELQYESMTIFDLNRWGVFTRQDLTWKINDQFNLTFGALVVDSLKETLLSQYDDNDMGYIKLKILF